MARRFGNQWFLTSSLLACAVIWTANAPAASYRVQPGDSLWALAKRHGVSVEALQKANGLSGDKIRHGQVLTIPGKAAQQPAEPSQTNNDETTGSKSKSSKPPRPPTPKQVAATDAGRPPRAAKAVSRATSSPGASAQRTGSRSKPAAASPSKSAARRAVPVSKSAPLEVDGLVGRPPAGVSRVVDPKALEAAEELYSSEQTAPPSTLEEIAPAWVLARPGPSTQGEKSNAARGGVYPCVTPDPGFGAYSKWVQVAPMAHVLAPTQMRLDDEGRFDVLFHFHGREPIRKEWVKVMEGPVLVAIDIGIDSGAYATAFSDPRTFSSVVQAVELEVAKRAGAPRATSGRIALSSWSAGFGAIEQILSQPVGRQVVDSVILLDGLHSGYVGQSLDKERMAPFARFAQQASEGNRMLFVSHSSILTTGYASTTETSNYLVWKVGGRTRPAEPLKRDPLGLERMSTFSSGDFHVRGFRGSGAADHCAHLGLMRDVLRVHLGPRWSTPRKTRSSESGAIAMGDRTGPAGGAAPGRGAQETR